MHLCTFENLNFILSLCITNSILLLISNGLKPLNVVLSCKNETKPFFGVPVVCYKNKINLGQPPSARPEIKPLH